MKHSRSIFILYVITLALIMFSCIQKKENLTLTYGDNRAEGINEILIEMLADYSKKRPQTRFVVEHGASDFLWQNKIGMYSTAGLLPDFFKWWSQPSHLDKLVKKGDLAVLPDSLFMNYDFLPGALKSNTYEGKVYGVPISTDIWVLYCNEILLEKYQITIPKTINDLYDSSNKLKGSGVSLIGVAGADQWPLFLVFDTFLIKSSRDSDVLLKLRTGERHFTDEDIVNISKSYQEFIRSECVCDSFFNVTSCQLVDRFLNNEYVMMLNGSWEVPIIERNRPASEKEHRIRIIDFPDLYDIVASDKEVMAWFGGNIVVSSRGEHLDEVCHVMHFLLQEYYNNSQEKELFISTMKRERPYNNRLLNDLLAIINSATSTGGIPTLDGFDNEFVQSSESLILELSMGLVTPETFCTKMESESQKARLRKSINID